MVDPIAFSLIPEAGVPASLHASMPSLCGMLVYSDVTSRVTRRVSSGRLFKDSTGSLLCL